VSYDLHITRAGWHPRSLEHPISREEWRAAAQGWPGMVAEGRVDYADTGPVMVYALPGAAEHPASLYWRLGQITVGVYPADTGEVARLAESMGARLVGDDGEVYLPDGTVVDSDANARPSLLARPLYVNEVGGAWTSLLRWEDCLDEQPVATQALRTFTSIASRDVATADLPDADMLLYDYRISTFDGEQTFTVTMARQFALPDSAGADIVRVECALSYLPVPELLELRSFHQWAPWDCDPDGRRAWLAEIAGRPEWSTLDRLVPQDLTLCGQPVYNSRISARPRPRTAAS